MLAAMQPRVPGHRPFDLAQTADHVAQEVERNPDRIRGDQQLIRQPPRWVHYGTLPLALGDDELVVCEHLRNPCGVLRNGLFDPGELRV